MNQEHSSRTAGVCKVGGTFAHLTKKTMWELTGYHLRIRNTSLDNDCRIFWDDYPPFLSLDIIRVYHLHHDLWSSSQRLQPPSSRARHTACRANRRGELHPDLKMSADNATTFIQKNNRVSQFPFLILLIIGTTWCLEGFGWCWQLSFTK